MSGKMIISTIIRDTRSRFPEIMKQHGKAQDSIRSAGQECVNRVFTDIVHMMHGVLRCIHGHVELRHDNAGNSRVIKIEPLFRIRRCKKLYDLDLNSLTAHLSKIFSMPADRGIRLSLYPEVQLSCEPYSPEDSKSVLIKSLVRIADTADIFIFQIINAVVQVNKSVLFIVRHGIYRKITASEILFQVRGK